MPIAVRIDMAKKDFEACLLDGVKEKPRSRHSACNKLSGFASMVSWAKKEAKGEEIIFCMESTGGYEFALACDLADAGFRVCVENPRRIKHFAISMGFANKTDRADARAIAAYALAMNPSSWVLMDKARRDISRLSRHRENLMKDLNRVQNRMEHIDSLPEMERKQLRKQEKFIQELIKELDLEQERLVEQSGTIKEKIAILDPIPGIAFLSGLTIVAEMPDVSLYDDGETWVAQAGMFPRRRESGQMTGKSRMSKAGNAHIRRMLYMSATVAMRTHPTIKAFRERLLAAGKTKKQARVACMRKLLLICFGVLKAHSQGRKPFYGTPPAKPKSQSSAETQITAEA